MKAALLTFLLVSQSLWGADAKQVRSSMVKIISTLQSTSKELKGSGLLINRDGKRYVITSDHVAGHVNEGFASHKAHVAATGEDLKLKFLGAEWGMGLALLEVLADKNPNAAIPFHELAGESGLKAGDRANLFGYPFESNDLTEESFAKTLDLGSEIPFYLFSPKLVEFEATVGEFGMSGGAAFTKDNRFVGTLAYQRIFEGRLENRVYAIPREKVVEWLNTYFTQGEKYKPHFSEPWWGQGYPEQMMLTNDGYFFAFRAFSGKFRMLAARLEALMVLKDGPSIRYFDKRGILETLRKNLDKDIMRPCEFGIFDRRGTPKIFDVVHPTQAIKHLDVPKISLFVVIGERHEEKYVRFRPAMEKLANHVTELQKKMQTTNSEWNKISQHLEEILASLKTIPPKPSVPGPEGEQEFFSFHWVGSTFLQLEANRALPGWTSLKTSFAKESEAVLKDFSEIEKALNSYEIRGTDTVL